MFSVVVVVLVIRLVGEAGLFELAVLTAGAVLGVLLGGVRRLGCSLGLGSDKHRVLAPLPLAMLVASAAWYALEPTRDVAPGALVTMVRSAPAAFAMFAYGCLQGVGAGWTVSDLTQARHVVESGKHPSPTSSLRVG